jgi:ATP-dependent DNA helicase RecG
MFPGSEATIFMFDDRLEITSPGSKIDGRLPEDVDVYNVSRLNLSHRDNF